MVLFEYMNKTLMFGSVVLGIVFVIFAGVYVVTPAGSLPSFMPGFQTGVVAIHYKHAIGSLILGLALFAFAWFKSAPTKNI
jgi:hypothetical protein